MCLSVVLNFVHSTKCGPCVSHIGPIRAEVGMDQTQQASPELGPVCGQIWLSFGQTWATSTELDTILCKFSPELAVFGSLAYLPRFGPNWAVSTEGDPNLAKLGPYLGDVDRIGPGLWPTLASDSSVARIRVIPTVLDPMLANLGPEFKRVWRLRQRSRPECVAKCGTASPRFVAKCRPDSTEGERFGLKPGPTSRRQSG